MDNQCLFCNIANGKADSFKLYEDEWVVVFLDINPSTNGDCLLVPKKHFASIEDLEEELSLHTLKVIKEMKKQLEEKLGCQGLTIVNNNGHGQDIKHFHIHLTPRYNDDELVHTFNHDHQLSLEEVYQKWNN